MVASWVTGEAVRGRVNRIIRHLEIHIWAISQGFAGHAARLREWAASDWRPPCSMTTHRRAEKSPAHAGLVCSKGTLTTATLFVAAVLLTLTARRSIHQIIQLDHCAGPLHAARVADDLLVGCAVSIALDVCLRLPFGVRNELAAFSRAQQLLGDAALLRNHQGGAFSLPDALRGLGLRRIDLDMNEAND